MTGIQPRRTADCYGGSSSGSGDLRQGCANHGSESTAAVTVKVSEKTSGLRRQRHRSAVNWRQGGYQQVESTTLVKTAVMAMAIGQPVGRNWRRKATAEKLDEMPATILATMEVRVGCVRDVVA